MAANYNNSAWFYDSLSRVVYGKALIKAQVYLLQYIQPKSTVLIVGGGTGWILDEIVRIYPSGLQITYVELSDKMMALSQKRNIGNNQVIYINKAIENVNGLPDFDVIITSFLFDNFTPQKLEAVFIYLHPLLKTNGLWLNADFQLTGKWWQNLLLKSMLVFFKILCGVESTKLPDFEKLFKQYRYREIAKETFFGEFVVSTVYEK
ncbi:MAG: class I SAM-dependent methyltransferase [Sphingobacteriaceae bacterium]|nr:MAG: class I SAM-dependent methyltransferase [Sphingobacteriaceae bacterium]